MNSSRYTTENYISQNPDYHQDDSPWKVKYIAKMMSAHNLKPKSIAEIGCGAGEILNLLHQQKNEEIDFHGFDISQSAIDLCNKKTQKNLKYHCADLTLEDRYYDLLLCIDVFEHVEDYFGFLKSVKTKAEYKIFHIPLDLSVLSIVMQDATLLEWRSRIGHIHYFTRELAIETLNECGYEIVDSFLTPAGIERAKKMSAKCLKYPRLFLSMFSKDFANRILGGYSLLVLAK